MEPSPPVPSPEFVQQLTACQSALYAFIVSLLGGVNDAHDVLQETNLKLCRKCAEFDPSQPFLRWAYVFARFEVMACRKRKQRSRLVLDDELVAIVADAFDISAEEDDARLLALEQCMQDLTPDHRLLISARYAQGESVQNIALRISKSENALAALFYRIRKLLADCVQEKLVNRTA